MVSHERIKELQKLIFEEYGQELSWKDTNLVANTLVDYFDLLSQMYWQTKNSSDE